MQVRVLLPLQHQAREWQYDDYARAMQITHVSRSKRPGIINPLTKFFMELINLFDKFQKILTEAMTESYNLGYKDGSGGELPQQQETKKKRFIKPTLPEVADYYKQYYKDSSNERANVFANKWLSFYESKSFKIGKNNMVDWKAAVRSWDSEELRKSITPDVESSRMLRSSNHKYQ